MQDIKGKVAVITDASWAVRFALDRPGMLVVLSGMSDEAQMADNLATVRSLESLSESEHDAIAEVTRQLLDKPTIGCTACRYCVDGCPMQIEIPELCEQHGTPLLRRGSHACPHG